MLSRGICNGIWKIKRVPAAVARTLLFLLAVADLLSASTQSLLCNMRQCLIFEDILRHTILIQCVGRQVYAVVPIYTGTAAIHPCLLPKMGNLLQHTKLINLLNILTHIVHHLLPVVKHNRESITRQSLNAFYARQSIHYSKGGSLCICCVFHISISDLALARNHS